MIRLATFNLYLGADLALLFGACDAEDLAVRAKEVRRQLAATRFTERADAIAALFARERPDVVGLQEVTRWTVAPLSDDVAAVSEHVLSDFLPELLAALDSAGCPYDPHALNPNFAGALPVDGELMSVAGANVTLIRRHGPVRVTAERTGTYRYGHAVATALEGVTFPIGRSWGLVELEVAGRSLWFANTHTEAYDGRTRAAQRDELLDVIGDPQVPVVVAGDFNATPARIGMPAHFRDAWTAAGNDPDAGATCGQAADLANVESTLADRIDYVFVNGATVTGCRVVGDRPEDRSRPHGLWPSDHACVIAEVELR
jgi:endonuclease/exonuclease/phosphatase family metal-dependent hydrolase